MQGYILVHAIISLRLSNFNLRLCMRHFNNILPELSFPCRFVPEDKSVTDSSVRPKAPFLNYKSIIPFVRVTK